MEIRTNIDQALITDISNLIENSKKTVSIQVNSEITILFWQIGNKVNQHILRNKRAEYGKEIIVTLSRELKSKFGKNFEEKKLRRMLQFAEKFRNFEKVVTLSRQLTWSHFIALIPIKKEEARYYYASKIGEERWSVRFTREQIEKKSFERTLIASSKIENVEYDLNSTFKDPYFLDFLELKDGYLENDLESAILKELELFILELGIGFTFVERQKRMIIDGDDFYLDLLFYHRKLKRLVAIELKIGKFKASYKGQMELYLKWLDKYDKQEGENHPIGLILCAESSNEQIELLEMQKDGIIVAEYWTELPPKKELEEKLHSALVLARERFARKNIIIDTTT